MGTLRVHPAPSPDDLDMQLMPSEAPGCSVQRPRRECFSFIASMMHMHLENSVYSAYQCPSEQHWCCSHEHAIQAVKTCIDEHHSAEQLVPVGTDPRIVQLPGHITHCAIASCDVALTTECYSVPISYATPGLGYTAYICDAQDPHWACSEEHAKLAAAACLEEHLEGGNHG